MNRRRFLTIASAAAFAPASALATETRWSGVALGARASITLRGPGGERAIQDALAALRAAEAEFSLYRPDSALSRLNAEGALAPSAQFRQLMEICDDLHRNSNGLFDPTVQPLWRALATGGDAAAASDLIGWDRVRIGERIILDRGQALTLNGVAQGFATDLVSEALARRGFANALVNIGEFRADAGRWRVGVASPDAELLDIVTLAGGAVATSSPGALRVGGMGHILGPDGRAPQWSTVSVQAPGAAIADGLSTALCLANADEIASIALKFPDARVSRWRDAAFLAPKD